MAADRTTVFGAKLRAARERRGVPLRDIANKTKISVGVLEALERNDFSRLPGGIFGRAFVRAYAVEVGLDPDDAIEEFLAQFPLDAQAAAGHPRTDDVEDGEALESERRTAATFLRVVAVSLPLIGAVLYFGSGIRRGPPPHEPSATPAAAPSAAAPPAAAGKQPAIAPATEAVTEPAPQQAGVPADQLTVTVSATGPCWVVATVDGANAMERLMQPGDERTFEVRRELILRAGDAEALTMKLNGAVAKPLGRAGEVVTARVNLTNFKDYLAQP